MNLRFSLLIHFRDLERASMVLARTDTVSLRLPPSPEEEEEGTAGNIDRPLADRVHALEEELHEASETFGLKLSHPAQVELVVPGSAIDEIEREISDLREDLESLRAAQRTANEERAALDRLDEDMLLLSPLLEQLSRISDLRYLTLFFGVVALSQWKKFEVPLVRTPGVFIRFGPHASGGKGSDLVVAATLPEHRAFLRRSVEAIGMREIDLPNDREGTPDEVRAAIRRDHAELDRKQQELDARREELSGRWGETIHKSWRRLLQVEPVAETLGKFECNGESLCTATGTVDEVRFDELAAQIEAETTEQFSLLSAPAATPSLRDSSRDSHESDSRRVS
ncbi:hypothetical protein [Salinispira pacifica]